MSARRLRPALVGPALPSGWRWTYRVVGETSPWYAEHEARTLVVKRSPNRWTGALQWTAWVEDRLLRTLDGRRRLARGRGPGVDLERDGAPLYFDDPFEAARAALDFHNALRGLAAREVS